VNYGAGTMAFGSDSDTLVLHALRLQGFAETDEVARATALDADEVAKHLDSFETEGWVRHRAGKVSGWTLTGDGRGEGEARLAAELDAAGVRNDVERAYRIFLDHNADLLQVCTDWQMREVGGRSVLNDHADPAYDQQVIDGLQGIDAAIQPACAGLAEVLERFDGYGRRLGHALDRVRAGEHDWFTKPTIDSYHTIWFELHENFLATLGIERGSE
jgi:hypothetical protein